MDQEVLNWMFGIIAAGVGFLVRSLWEAVKDLQQSDKELADKVAHIEVIVAGNYVTRQEFDKVVSRLFTKLDNIETAVGNKADR